LTDPKYKYLNIGIHTFLAPGEPEIARRWYFIGNVSINAPVEPPTSTERFTDVKAGDPFYEDIMWAVENGITTGTGDGSTFSPYALVNRGQMVAFLHRLSKLHGGE
jgi:hypothetical protein